MKLNILPFTILDNKHFPPLPQYSAAHKMVKVFLGVYNIKNEIPVSAVRYPSHAVKEFCKVPIDHYFTTQAIPGFRNDLMFVTVLKKFNIKKPLDLVNYLRYMTRGRRRLGVNIMASILMDFFQEVAEICRLPEKMKSQTTASICIAIAEAKLYYGHSKLSFTSLPLYS